MHLCGWTQRHVSAASSTPYNINCRIIVSTARGAWSQDSMDKWSHPVDIMSHHFLHQLLQVHFRPDRHSLVPHTQWWTEERRSSRCSNCLQLHDSWKGMGVDAPTFIDRPNNIPSHSQTGISQIPLASWDVIMGGHFFQILPMPVHQDVHTYTVTTQTVELCQCSSTSGMQPHPPLLSG